MMYSDNDPTSKLASFLSSMQLDPASAWPGAPPMLGRDILPHVYTIAGQQGLVGRTYLNPDEAVMHDPQNAERMRNEALISECMRARQLATANLKWHIKPLQADMPGAVELGQMMTRIVAETPRFTEYRRVLLEAVWMGRYAIVNQFASKNIDGERRIAVGSWSPRHGDKLIFPYNDGVHPYDPERIGIRVGTSGVGSSPFNRDQVQPTQYGLCYWLNKAERKTVVVHRHQVEDGPFEDVRVAGRIHGVGVRSQIYWTWYAMNDYLRRAMEYLDRAAFGVELWKFPANNPRAREETEKAATRHVGGGRSIILVPVMPGQQEELYGVTHIEPGLQGVDTLLQVIRQFFEEKMKRVIVGQTLTSEAQSTGMGSGVADAHLATFHDIIMYDARNLEETISEQLVRPLQEWNFPQQRHIKLVFTIDTETDNVMEKLNAYRQAFDMGMRIKTVDVATAIGVAEAGPTDSALENPQLAMARMQMSGGMLPPQQPASPGTPSWQLGEPSPQAGVQGPSNTFPASPIPR